MNKLKVGGYALRKNGTEIIIPINAIVEVVKIDFTNTWAEVLYDNKLCNVLVNNLMPLSAFDMRERFKVKITKKFKVTVEFKDDNDEEIETSIEEFYTKEELICGLLDIADCQVSSIKIKNNNTGVTVKMILKYNNIDLDLLVLLNDKMENW